MSSYLSKQLLVHYTALQTFLPNKEAKRLAEGLLSQLPNPFQQTGNEPFNWSQWYTFVWPTMQAAECGADSWESIYSDRWSSVPPANINSTFRDLMQVIRKPVFPLLLSISIIIIVIWRNFLNMLCFAERCKLPNALHEMERLVIQHCQFFSLTLAEKSISAGKNPHVSWDMWSFLSVTASANS